MTFLIAYCDRQGIIDFGETLPEGRMPIHYGDAEELKEKVQVRSRHAYDGKTLLVPGIPEADSEEEALDALARWIEWCGFNPNIPSASC